MNQFGRIWVTGGAFLVPAYAPTWDSALLSFGAADLRGYVTITHRGDTLVYCSRAIDA